MRLSRKADYAVRAMVDLAARPVGDRVPIHDVAVRQEIPYTFLPRIIPDLVRCGLLKSYRGANGGVALARSPDEISVLKVIEAAEGPLTLNRCTAHPSECDREAICPQLKLWERVQEDLDQTLASMTLADLVNNKMK
jgi:Rrf2 family protein